MSINQQQIQTLTEKLSQSSKNEASINSSDAIEMISHSSEFIIDITTPIGMTFTTTTKFIGYHSNNLIFIEIPEVSKDEMLAYFQDGFWLNVRAFSQKGEGAIIKFRCQIMHTLKEPVSMMMLSVPSMMKIQQLRKEPRYEVKLSSKILVNDHKVKGEVRDLSRSGCRFVIASLTKNYNIGDPVLIEIETNHKVLGTSIKLTGHLCNSMGTRHFAKYGVKFDSFGEKSSRSLLSNMRFNGTQFVLKK